MSLAISTTPSRPAASSASGMLSSGAANGANSSGLVYTSSGPTYNGQLITLADIQSDESGRFTDAQKAQAVKLQNMQAALSTLETFRNRQSSSDVSGSAGDSADLSASDESVVLSLSQAAMQRLTGTTTEDEPVTPPDMTIPKVSFSNSLQMGGFTISAMADANTGASKITISGPNGLELSDTVFRAGKDLGSGESWGGSGVMPKGVGLSGTKEGNKEYITLYSDTASLSSAALATTAGIASQSTANAQFASITFVVDFTTGAISATQSEASASATAAQVRPSS